MAVAGRWVSMVFAVAALALPGSAVAARTLYVTGSGSSTVAPLAIAPDGSLSPAGAVAATGSIPTGVAITPSGSHAYVTNFASGQNSVSGFAVNADGALSALANSPFAANARPVGLTAAPDGSRLFVVNGNSAQLTGFNIAPDGQIAQVPGSPFAAGNTTTRGAALTPSGRYLYIANFAGGQNNIAGFEVGANGVPSALPGSPFPAGTQPLGLALTPDGAHLYASNTGGNNVSGFAISADGALTPVPGSPFATQNGTYGLAVSPNGRNVYVANFTSESVSAFAIDAQGSLSPVPGSPLAVGANLTAVAVSPDSRFVYFGHQIGAPGQMIFAFAAAGDGSLTPISGSPFASGVTNPDLGGLAITPNQGPAAAFAVTPGAAGVPSAFNASGSTDSDGQIAGFAWDFGDATPVVEGGSAVEHTYAEPGVYTATLTVTDNEVCSTALVFTGQTASCNGGPGARVTQQVTVPDGTDPVLKLSGPRKQDLDGKIEIKARCDEACEALAKGKLVVTTRTAKAGKFELAKRTRSVRLKKARKSLPAGQKKTLKLKVPSKAAKIASRGLRGGGKVKAKIKVKATDAAGNSTTGSRSSTLRR